MVISKIFSSNEALQSNIQEYVKRYIIEHRLTAGAPLPGEVEIANTLHVSRNAVREAIKVLQTLGIVETRHGQGTFVGDLSMRALVAGLSFRVLFDASQNLQTLRELLEIREILECDLIVRLPQMTTPAYLADLRLLVAQMEARAVHAESFAEEDRAFHEILYRPLGNHLIIQLLQAFWDIYHATREQLVSPAEDPMRTVRVHQAIVNALATGDGEDASAAMVAHFAGIRSRLAHVHAIEHCIKNSLTPPAEIREIDQDLPDLNEEAKAPCKDGEPETSIDKGQKVIHQGDIYWVQVEDLGGSEPSIRHPHVVIQEDILNHSRIKTVVACALTSNRNRATIPGNVLLEVGEANLSKQSVVEVSKVSTVDKAQLGEYIGSLSEQRIHQILAGMQFQQRSFFTR